MANISVSQSEDQLAECVLSLCKMVKRRQLCKTVRVLTSRYNRETGLRIFTIRRHSYAVKKRGQNVKYQGRKSAKTVNHVVLCDNAYNLLALSDGIDGNHHDSYQLIDTAEKMINSLDRSLIDYKHSHLNADSGFDTKAFLEFIQQHDMIANIRQNKRNTKTNNTLYRSISEYIYQSRFKIEVIFAWLDSYKRILVRFEKLSLHFNSWLNIAAALINFRHLFN